MGETALSRRTLHAIVGEGFDIQVPSVDDGAPSLPRSTSTSAYNWYLRHPDESTDGLVTRETRIVIDSVDAVFEE